MDNVNRMLKEYVYPFILLTLIGFAIVVVFGNSIGEAIDKEIQFQDQVYKVQGGKNNENY